MAHEGHGPWWQMSEMYSGYSGLKETEFMVLNSGKYDRFFLLTPPLQLTIPKVTIFHPPWLLVYGTIQASRDSISGETLKTHWGDDIFVLAF